MPKITLILVGVAALALTACAATAPVYQQAASEDAYGYRETPIEDNRYRVSYRGRDSAAANDFALLRAAELTLARGYDWFEIVSADTEQLSSRSSGSSVSIGGSTGGYRSGVGVGVGIGLPLGGGSSGGSVRILEVIMGEGDKPDSPNAYDAFTVQQNIRGQVNGQ